MTQLRPEVHAAGWAHLALHQVSSLAALRDELEALRGDPGVRCVVLSGDAFADDAHRRGQPLRWLEFYPLPTIFSFEGDLEGLVLEVAASCDIRVCASRASVQWPVDVSARMMRLITGRGAARVNGPGRIDAPSALRLGLVSHVAESETALDYASGLAATIASRGLATRLAKEAVWRGLEIPLEHALRFETDLTLLLQTTKDRAEGVRAFLEKRPPKFTGE